MTVYPPRTATLAAIAVSAVTLAACGSGTKTVSVASTAQQPAHTTGSASTARTGATATTPANTNHSPTTRSAPEPAFTESQRGHEGVAAAAALLRAKGFTATNTADYRPQQALQVLVGVRTGSGDGYGQQAFFFVNGRYIGTDTSQPSASVRVVSQGDTEVTLAYPLYRNGDALCCPGAGHAQVRFELNNGKLTAIDPIPPLNSKTRPSRY